MHRRDTVQEDSPLARGERQERNDDVEVLRVDGDRPEHEERRCEADGEVAHKLVEEVERLAIDDTGIVGRDHPAQTNDVRRCTQLIDRGQGRSLTSRLLPRTWNTCMPSRCTLAT